MIAEAAGAIGAELATIGWLTIGAGGSAGGGATLSGALTMGAIDTLLEPSSIITNHVRKSIFAYKSYLNGFLIYLAEGSLIQILRGEQKQELPMQLKQWGWVGAAHPIPKLRQHPWAGVPNRRCR